MGQLRLRTLRRVAIFLFLLAVAAIVLRWISLERWRASQNEREEISVEESPAPQPTDTPWPTPTKPPVIIGKLDTARLFNGVTLHAEVEPTPGGFASVERSDPQSYVLDLKLRVRVPTPNTTIDDLAKINPQLPKILPGLAVMIQPDSVSPFFKEIYETKVKQLRENLGRLDQLLSRHNFFDVQTVLRLHDEKTKRRAVLLQSDMDVDADGSDADRLPEGSGVSPNFKPFTSYRWAKKTSAPNPYLAPTEEKMKRWEAEFAVKTTVPERKRELKAAIAQARDEIDSMKKFSYLIGATDPYIVLPGGFAKVDGAKMGDVALVIFGETIYPAIVGDVGPSDKAGEASLRIAKEINSLATPNNRPVSELKVTYLIFPGTAETFGPPDLEKLQTRTEMLVNEIGGATVPLHHWENILPTPTPVPTPTPSPIVTPSPNESPSTSSSVSPEPTFAFPISSASPSA